VAIKAFPFADSSIQHAEITNMKENRTDVRLAHPEKLIATLSFPVAGESVGAG
jgi:hypothetical protein